MNIKKLENGLKVLNHMSNYILSAVKKKKEKEMYESLKEIMKLVEEYIKEKNGE